MRVIYKYRLLLDHEQTIMLPEGFQLLSLEIQDGYPWIWCIVNSANDFKPVNIKTYPTGMPMKHESLQYIGTIHKDGFVWHFFFY